MPTLLGLLAVLPPLLLCLASPTTAKAAEIRVLASVALKPALNELAPRFEARSGHKLVIEYGTAASARRRIEAGDPFDVAVLSPGATEDLIKSGSLLPEPRALVGVTVAAIAYRSDTPRPDAGTPEAFKAAVLGARSISLSNPALGGSSSTFFMAALKRLGLEEAVGAKLILTGGGEGAVPVAAGRAQLGVALASEIAGVPGVSWVPLLPADPASTVRLVATLSGKAAKPKEGRALIGFLLSPEGEAVRREKFLAAQ